MIDRLQKTAAQTVWEDCGLFLSWAVWGYLSADSRYRGSERLLEMSRTWMDRLHTNSQKEDFSLGFWRIHHYTIPLLELEARPALQEKLGIDRYRNYRQLVIDQVRAQTKPESYNDLLRRADKYINIATHPMPIYIHGWLLTGERKYLRMAQRIIHVLARDQLPNGMFPYRYRIHGDQHCEYEAMYYHAMNVRALYLYWWATNSDLARDTLRKSIPYYPLNLEPPYHFNGGADIWWKDQWRTFWPHHIAMVAAATGDGENATIANAMASDKVSHDRYDLIIGWHAYQRMGLQQVKAKRVRGNYVMKDPDIRGVRLRFGRWASTFTTGSYTYTRASAMAVHKAKGYSALHMARPFVRVAPLEKPYRTEPDYSTLGPAGAKYRCASGGQVAALATAYSPSLTSHTWRENQPVAKWRMTELWLMTDSGMLGLISSAATGKHEARELCHQFRFISAEPQELGTKTWKCGELRFRVWRTDFSLVVNERMRRYALGQNDRRDWQIALTDSDRSPEQIAQNPQPAPLSGEAPELKLPELQSFEDGYERFSLVECSPMGAVPFTEASMFRKALIGLRAKKGNERFVVVHNPSSAGLEWAPGPGDRVKARHASWSHEPITTPARIPPGGVLLLRLRMPADSSSR